MNILMNYKVVNSGRILRNCSSSVGYVSSINTAYTRIIFHPENCHGLILILFIFSNPSPGKIKKKKKDVYY